MIMKTNGLSYIDLFAGAGGLSEGFMQSGYESIAHVEMNEYAAKTIETRIAYFYLKEKKQLEKYYQYERGEISRDELLSLIPKEDLNAVINEEMSPKTIKGIFERIDTIMNEKEIQQVDVIIGGPPCQAYSLVGRAQSSHMIIPMEDDPRNELYKMYVQFLIKYILINQLSFECGYGSSYIRERIYCEMDDNKFNMVGVLIYTASGDSEGSLGGLVRQGEKGRIEDTIISALKNALWCTSDPVCIQSLGQGTDSCNLAACHNCAVLPETCCENGNRLLDRGVLIGTISEPEIGYFSKIREIG